MKTHNTTHAIQKKPGIFLPILLIIMSAYPPLSTDMYLPALERMMKGLHTQGSVLNMSLVLFFIFFAFSTLIWGPISDKYGRKPALLVGILIYTLGSIACTLSFSVYQFTIARVFQAIGAGAPVTISIAIVQDRYSGESKKKILAALSALMMVAPVAAPLLGSFILSFAGWRVIFITLSLLGIFSLAGSLLLKESIPFKKDESVVAALGGIFRVTSNVSFRRLLIVFSLVALFVLGFVGGSSLIFISGFGVDEKTFSYLFGINAFFSIIGAALYVPINRIIKTSYLVSVVFLLVTISGALSIFIGNTGPRIFLLCVLPGTLAAAILRPLSVDVLLDMGRSETGAASAMINFVFNIIGSTGIALISLEWMSRITIYGIMTLLVGISSLISWGLISKSLNSPPILEECGIDA